MPGFKEFHGITALVAEASALAGYMVKLAPLMTKRIKHEKDADVDRVHAVDSEVFRLRKEIEEKLRQLRIDGGEEMATPSPYPSEQRSKAVPFVEEPRHDSMAPPPVPQQQQPSPVASQNKRQPSMQFAHHQQSCATSASSQVEPASTRRSSAYSATLASQKTSQSPTNSANIPTFSIEFSDPTLEAKLTKLKARLETEIGEVDNLTEEKKRLEERIKELEAMIEDERERRRGEIDVGMKDRKSFLSVLEGVVEMGRREGDVRVKREGGVLGEFLSASDCNGNGGDKNGGDTVSGQGEETDIATLKKEVETLRERNRVCESALEHIARETRHMEETGRKVEESRRGIDLVLGRVLAARENPVQDNISLLAAAVPAEEGTVRVLAIEGAPALEAAAPGKAKDTSLEAVEVNP